MLALLLIFQKFRGVAIWGATVWGATAWGTTSQSTDFGCGSPLETV